MLSALNKRLVRRMRAGIALILIFCLAGCGKKTAVKEYSVPETQVADGGIAVYTAFEVQHNFINVFTVYGVREKDTVFKE